RRAQALLAQDSAALEVLLMPQAVLRQGWNHLRGFTAWSRRVAHGALDACELQEWSQQLRDRARNWDCPEERMVRPSASASRAQGYSPDDDGSRRRESR